MRSRLGPLAALSLLIAAGGCRGCFCTNAAKALAETPPPDVVEQKTREALTKDPSKLSVICGLRVSALTDMVVTVVRAGATTSEVKVEGKAVPSDAGTPADEEGAGDTGDAGDEGDDDDASAATISSARAPLVVDRTKALLCAGVLVVALTPDLDEHGNAKGWHTVSIEVDSVQTAGVHFDKTKASAPSRHHRRRHHHH